MRALLFLFTALSLTACGVDSRGIITQIHDAEIGPDTVRVELRGMTDFVVLRSGDRGAFGGARDGELQDMTLSLSARDEFSSAMGSGNNVGISNRTDPDSDHIVYTTIEAGDVVFWQRSATYTDEAIWVNMPRDAILTLRMQGRDLDCSGERVCGRDDDGTFTAIILLPVAPARLSDGCPPNQRFNWTQRDGEWLFEGARSWSNQLDHRPVLRPLNGFICITNPVPDS